MRQLSSTILFILCLAMAVVAAEGWPNKASFDSWATQRVARYNANSQIVATCGQMTEIGSPQPGTVWVFGRWSCEKEYLETIAETVGIAFRQQFGGGVALSIHIWDAATNRKLATKRMS